MGIADAADPKKLESCIFKLQGSAGFNTHISSGSFVVDLGETKFFKMRVKRQIYFG